jgi:hypothetical protein
LPALRWLKKTTGDFRRWPAVLAALLAPGAAPDADACLQRLALAGSSPSLGERLLARLVRGALARTGS